MTDEGASFPLVCEIMGWRHILDRKHFTDQIMTTWQNVYDPQAYYNSIISILNAPTVEKYNTLMQKCKQQFSTPKAIAYLKKMNSISTFWFLHLRPNATLQAMSQTNVWKRGRCPSKAEER